MPLRHRRADLRFPKHRRTGTATRPPAHHRTPQSRGPGREAERQRPGAPRAPEHPETKRQRPGEGGGPAPGPGDPAAGGHAAPPKRRDQADPHARGRRRRPGAKRRAGGARRPRRPGPRSGHGRISIAAATTCGWEGTRRREGHPGPERRAARKRGGTPPDLPGSRCAGASEGPRSGPHCLLDMGTVFCQHPRFRGWQGRARGHEQIRHLPQRPDQILSGWIQ